VVENGFLCVHKEGGEEKKGRHCDGDKFFHTPALLLKCTESCFPDLRPAGLSAIKRVCQFMA
jgi:hypothetical protein